jgi:branched-chain amino acid transport system ATP-binding protein
MLKMSGVHTYYGESHILQGIALSVGPAQCVALLGRNGAGKTTTLRSILGLTPARRGQVIFKGTDITRLATHRIVRSGIAFVPEDRGIFRTVTVEEHLAIAYGASKHRSRVSPLNMCLRFSRLAEAAAQSGRTAFQAVSSRCWQSGAR